MAVQVLGKVAYFNKGAYNSQTNYEINDVVSYNGSSYVSLNDNNQGNLPTNTNYWSVVAEKGDKGDTGKPFVIEKTYSTIESMVADYDNMNVNDYVMIQGSIEEQENATLWTKREVEVSPYKWAYLADFSGASGITGATPNIHIGNVTEGNEPSVTRRSGSSNENPILDFVLKTGAKGDTGATGNGISSIEKTSTSGLVDTYTITFTNGTSTTIEVTNGRGIVSIAKTGTVDYVDTYTITYNDGTTSTFEVANSEVTEEEFDEVVDELNYLYDDLPKVEGEGTSLTLDNTRKGKMSNVLRGNASQESTTGKNLCPVSSPNFVSTATWSSLTGDNANTYTNGTKITLNSGTYTITFSERTNIDSIQVNGLTPVLYGNGTFTINSETDIYIRIKAIDNTIPISCKIQLEIGTTATDWEKYTGNQPSPSPDYPQDVHVVSGDNVVEITGRNLFHDYTDTYSTRGITITKGENELTLNGTYDKAYNGDFWLTKSIYGTSYNDNIILLKANTTYTFKLYFVEGTMTGTPNCALSSRTASDKTFAWNYRTIVKGTNGYQDTWTPTEDIYLAAIRFPVQPAMNVVFDNLKIRIQVEKSSVPTSYEPYQEQNYSVNLGTMELCKIGDYQDRIYKDSGKWYIEKKIGKVVLDGSENWATFASANYEYQLALFQGLSSDTINQYFSALCNRYTNHNTTGANLLNYEFSHFSADAGYGKYRFIRMRNNEITTLESWKAELQNNNLILYVPLATPTTTEITDSTLISQLEALKTATSYDNQTNISQENNDLPFIISTSAFMSLKYIFGNLETRVAELETSEPSEL